MLVVKEKTPEKKGNLRSINNRLPSAKPNKEKDYLSMSTNNGSNIKPKHIFLIQKICV